MQATYEEIEAPKSCRPCAAWSCKKSSCCSPSVAGQSFAEKLFRSSVATVENVDLKGCFPVEAVQCDGALGVSTGHEGTGHLFLKHLD